MTARTLEYRFVIRRDGPAIIVRLDDIAALLDAALADSSVDREEIEIPLADVAAFLDAAPAAH